LLKDLGVTIDSRGKMPSLVLYHPTRDWLLLVESATSDGPIDEERLEDLARLFNNAKPGLVYVTAFSSRSSMTKHPGFVAWGTHAWFADEPEHMIHFNGIRFLGPYEADI
jgi:type II restriction enzyme